MIKYVDREASGHYGTLLRSFVKSITFRIGLIVYSDIADVDTINAAPNDLYRVLMDLKLFQQSWISQSTMFHCLINQDK